MKTRKEMFLAILALDEVAENDEMTEFLKHQIDLLDSHTGSKKLTKTQQEGIGIKNTIYEVLCESNTPMRVKDLAADERLSNYSPSRITALLGQMLPEKGDGRVIRTVEKKVAYFSIPKEEEEEE